MTPPYGATEGLPVPDEMAPLSVVGLSVTNRSADRQFAEAELRSLTLLARLVSTDFVRPKYCNSAVGLVIYGWPVVCRRRFVYGRSAIGLRIDGWGYRWPANSH